MKCSFLYWVCVSALAMLPLIGCGEVSTSAGETGGVDATGGSGGMGGTGGARGQVVDEPSTKMIPVACTNNFNLGPVDAVLQHSYVLTVEPLEQVSSGSDFGLVFGGHAVIPEMWLDLLQWLAPGGVSEIKVSELNASVAVRSGATGPNISLHVDESEMSPGSMRFCTFPTERVCASDGDCDFGACLPPTMFVEIPHSEDCTPGGFCDSAGKSDQCDSNGFCVASELKLPFKPELGAFEAADSGDVLIGWNEDVPTPPYAIYGEAAGPNGARWIVGKAHFAFECYMGRANDDGTAALTLADDDLISIPIID
jgi:hypothetical protein